MRGSQHVIIYCYEYAALNRIELVWILHSVEFCAASIIHHVHYFIDCIEGCVA